MSEFTTLRGTANYGDAGHSDLLETGLVFYLQWGLLGIGAFSNVTRNSLGAFGGDQSQLRMASDPRYTDGQVWEGFRQDWVWETGVQYAYQPIHVSGVYVSGVFYGTASTTGVYAHEIDYPRGRVVFTNPISPSSTVQAEFSYRNVRLTTSDAPWWQEVQLNSFRVDDSTFLQVGSGNWNILADNRIQLPAIVVESVMNVTLNQKSGLEIGSMARIHRQDVLFHVLAESPFDRKQLHDLLVNQWERRFYLVDKDALFNADAFPLDQDGSLRPSGLMYPALVAAPSGQGGYQGRLCWWEAVRSIETDSLPPIYEATVRATLETDLP